jgi:glutaredoxin 3
MPQVEIYLSPFCGYCWKARLMLWRKGILYRKIPIRFYFGFKLPTANFKEMLRRTGGDRTIPQIFVDGEYLGTEEALDELERRGELEKRLGGS